MTKYAVSRKFDHIYLRNLLVSSKLLNGKLSPLPMGPGGGPGDEALRNYDDFIFKTAYFND